MGYKRVGVQGETVYGIHQGRNSPAAAVPAKSSVRKLIPGRSVLQARSLFQNEQVPVLPVPFPGNGSIGPLRVCGPPDRLLRADCCTPGVRRNRGSCDRLAGGTGCGARWRVFPRVPGSCMGCERSAADHGHAKFPGRSPCPGGGECVPGPEILPGISPRKRAGPAPHSQQPRRRVFSGPFRSPAFPWVRRGGQGRIPVFSFGVPVSWYSEILLW
jgi:hypothetical protein